jgi:outer membrane protein
LKLLAGKVDGSQTLISEVIMRYISSFIQDKGYSKRQTKIFIMMLVVCLFEGPVFVQEPVVVETLSLEQVILLAKEGSPAALQAQTVKENRYWQYNTFLSNYKPQLVLSGGDEFSREVVATRQNDGTYAFPQVNQNYTSLNLSLEQHLGFSGSRIHVSSSLNRFDNFYNSNILYSGNPAYIGFTQLLFFYNWLKWDKKVHPLLYEESKREYLERMEDISVQVSSLFFDLLLAEVAVDIAAKNLENNQSNLTKAQERQGIGKAKSGDLLQLRLSVMRAKQQMARANLDLKSSTLRLKSYVGLNSHASLVLIPPTSIPDFGLNTGTALSEALRSRRAAVAFKRRKLEAARGVATAKGNGGFDAHISATFGLTNRGEALTDVYSRPDDQQAVVLNFSIPVMDWGRQKSRIKTAEANQKLIDYTVAQDRVNFEQEIITHVDLFDMLRQQVVIAEESDKIAQERYEDTRSRYLAGEENLTNLNIAMQEKDEAGKSFIAGLRDFWIAYYRLRRLTLYDFEKDILILLQEEAQIP